MRPDELVECKHCHRRIDINQAKAWGWNSSTETIPNPLLEVIKNGGIITSAQNISDENGEIPETIEVNVWECDPVKLFDHVENKYVYHPRCVTKKLKSGVVKKPITILTKDQYLSKLVKE